MTTDHHPAQKDAPLIQCDARAVLINGQLIVPLPPDASAALPSRGQVAVSGTVDGQAFRTVVEPDGRRGHWIKVDDAWAATKKFAAGDEVALALSPSASWPEPDVPDDLRAALDDASDVIALWESVTPMARWEWVRWIRATKNPATRAKRVEVGISKMRSGKRRPCCFDLAACTEPELARSGKLMAPDAS